MSWKETTVGIVTVATMATGAAWYFQPRSPADVREHQQQVQQEQMGDQQESENERRRREAFEGMDAENRDKLRPGEHRPPPKPRVKLR